MKSKELGDWADRPVALPHAVSPSPPLRGRCRRQRGVPCLLALSGRRQPTPPKGGEGELCICHSVTSPPARGGEGIWAETLLCGVRILLCSPTAEAEGVRED